MALIGAVLAEMEGADPDKVALICLVHDITESRIGDHHKVNARYMNTDEAEMKVLDDQLALLPQKLADKWRGYTEEYNNRNTKEGIVAKDADWLEVALTAKEYLELGYKGAQEWIDNVEKALETDSAKQILKLAKESDFINSWWQGLQTMTYKKLDN
jgi:putative hydrolase of HD superfamily